MDNDRTFSTREVGRAVSPSGCCEAYVVESSIDGVGENTQVIVSFVNETCDAGVVSSNGAGLAIKLNWLAEGSLSRGVTLRRNASGEHIKCGRHEVHIVLQERD